MNRIHRKLEYSLLALKIMSRKPSGELTSAKEVSVRSGAPFDATSRVMQLMAQKGILKSEQGTHGGYKIVRDLNCLSLAELMEVSVGPMQIVKCVGDGGCELIHQCEIQDPLIELNHRIKSFYSAQWVGELLATKKLSQKEQDQWSALAGR